MSAPSRIRVHLYQGEIQLTLPGGRQRLHLRRVDAEALTYAVSKHYLNAKDRITRRDPPIDFSGTPLRKLLHELAELAGMDPYRWVRCLHIPVDALFAEEEQQSEC